MKLLILLSFSAMNGYAPFSVTQPPPQAFRFLKRGTRPASSCRYLRGESCTGDGELTADR